MRLLLDACITRRLGTHFSSHQVSTAHEMRWGDLDNGDLLEAMSGRFDVLITVDRGIPKQQHIEDRPVAVLVFRANSNRLADLLPLVPRALLALETISKGQVAIVG